VSSDDGNPRRCQGITSQGKRCEKIVGPAQTLCFLHDPTRASERSELAAKAAKAAKARHASPCDEIVEIRQEMKSLADQVRQKKVTLGVGSVVNQILGNMLRTFEQQRRQKEFDDLERRLEEVERRYARRNNAQEENDYGFGSGRWVR
jgi:hypothetical protein